MPATASQQQVEDVVAELNADPTCTGFLVQLPLPGGLDPLAVIELIDPAKDADGLHPINLGRLVLGQLAPLQATPRGIVELLRAYDIRIDGADVVLVGRGITVGRSLALLLTRRSENATVTQCHTGTKDLASHLRRADIVIAAAGTPGFITAADVKPGAVLVDVGITRTDEGLVGDIHPSAAEVASWIAPIPGGVGPMTRAMLLTNVVEAAERPPLPRILRQRCGASSTNGSRSRSEEAGGVGGAAGATAALWRVAVRPRSPRRGSGHDAGGDQSREARLRRPRRCPGTRRSPSRDPPGSRAGLLAVRSRAFDIVATATLAAVLVALSVVVPPPA